MVEQTAEIGVFGGSGFYELGDDVNELSIKTSAGATSDVITIATIAGRKVAFLPRHGRKHQLPPHKIPYKANTLAMKKLGVKCIIAPNAVGSLQAHIKPGDFLIADQFVDRTSGRDCTLYDGPITTHISTADPYCPKMRIHSIEACKKLSIPVHENGTVVVIQGPRFSTKAESAWFTKMGWEIINMTQYPECVLARELEMCYVNVSLVTDYDVGLVADGLAEAVSHEEVIRVFTENSERARNLVIEMIESMPKDFTCSCQEALKGARF